MEKKYSIDTEENKQFLNQMRADLLWFGAHFPAEGGGSCYLGGDGQPQKEKPVETWITSRMVHVYSIGSMLAEGNQEEKARLKGLAQAALKGLTGRLRDQENGGWYAGRMPDGAPLEGKLCYAHAFVMLAASSAVLAEIDGAKDLLDEAAALFDERFWREREGLCADTWDTAFTRLEDYRGLNANMHTVEAFLALADVTGREQYRERAGRIIGHVIGWAEENDWRIPEHYSSDWEPLLDFHKDRPDDPFKPYGATPGHGIEWARLIVQWACSVFPSTNSGEKKQKENEDLQAKPRNAEVRDMKMQKELFGKNGSCYIAAAEQLYRRAVSDAWHADGADGIVYTTDWQGRPVVHDRMHWTVAEAVNTSAVLYRVTGKMEYAQDYARYMRYIDEVLLDHENGSWHHQLDESNHLKETVWPGKPDLYHAFQATLIPYGRVELSIAAAVQKRHRKQVE